MDTTGTMLKVPFYIQAVIYSMGGIFAIIGLCVIPTVVKRHRCCVSIYIIVICLLLLVQFFAVTPLLVMFFFRSSSVDKFCDKDFSMVPTRWGKEQAKKLYNYVEEIDTELQKSQQLMCTREYCPCMPVDYKNWAPAEQALLLGTANKDFKLKSYNKGERRFEFVEDGFIETFGQCYEIIKKRKPELCNFSPNLKKTLETLEGNLNCQGICKRTLFWFFRPISEGQPPRNCAVAIKEEYDRTFGNLAWGLFSVTLLTFCLLMCTCGLCRKKKNKNQVLEFDRIHETGSPHISRNEVYGGDRGSYSYDHSQDGSFRQNEVAPQMVPQTPERDIELEKNQM